MLPCFGLSRSIKLRRIDLEHLKISLKYTMIQLKTFRKDPPIFSELVMGMPEDVGSLEAFAEGFFV